MNRTGQLDVPVITMIIIVVGIIIAAPIVLKIFTSIQAPFSDALKNQTGAGGNNSATAFNYVMNTGINFWDKLCIFLFFLAFIVMIISSFLIDTNPFWIVLYIIIAFFAVLFIPSVMSAVDAIYTNSVYLSSGNSLTYVNFLRNNMAKFVVGMFVISGIIIYGKVRLFSSSSVGGSRR
jgi:hypothetical protein